MTLLFIPRDSVDIALDAIVMLHAQNPKHKTDATSRQEIQGANNAVDPGDIEFQDRDNREVPLGHGAHNSAVNDTDSAQNDDSRAPKKHKKHKSKKEKKDKKKSKKNKREKD